MWMVFDEFKRFKCDGKIGCVQDFICKLLILFDANVIGFFVFCILYKWSLRGDLSFSLPVKKALPKKSARVGLSKMTLVGTKK